MAVATMAVSAVGMSASAYGGTSYFTVNGVSIEKYIDGARTAGGGHTKCNSLSCSNVHIKVIGTYASTGSKSDEFNQTRGTASVGIGADSGKIFKQVNTEHKATINGVTNNPPSTMVVYIG